MKKTAKTNDNHSKLYYLVGAALSLVAFVVEPWLGFAQALVVGVMYLASQRSAKRRRAGIQRYVEQMESTANSAGKSSMLTMPFAMMVFRPDTQEILWSNDNFQQQMGLGEELFSSKLDEALPEFSPRWLMEGKTECPDVVAVGGKLFHVFGSLNQPSGKNNRGILATTYWIDVTEQEILRVETEENRPVVAILLLDNYEELMKVGTDATRSAMLAQIDEKISNWVQDRNGLLCKYDRNRYLFVLAQKEYETLREGKFSILENVRSVVTEDGVAATLSIGIGKDAPTFETLFQYAGLSIEMALSRGGDQVVVKNRMDFEFYGGKNKATEKRTKVKSRVMANALGELISDATQIFVMGHKNADMDALGAAAGICCIARKRGKKAQIVIDREDNAAGPILQRLSALPEYEDAFISGSEAFIQAKAGALLVVVDTNRPDFVESEQLLDTCQRVAVIDHHRRAASYIESAALNFHDPYASSASELVSELLQYLASPSDLLRAEAEAMLAGIVLDTKNFTMRTGGRTFEAAALLRRAGADTADVHRLFQSDLAGMLERYDIIRHAEMYRDDIAIAALEEETDRVTAAKAADELLTLRGVRASFVLFRHGGGVNLSARSLCEFNVQIIMEKLGGGGNSTTAGGQVPDGTVEGVHEQLLAAIDAYIEE